MAVVVSINNPELSCSPKSYIIYHIEYINVAFRTCQNEDWFIPKTHHAPTPLLV